MIKKLLYIFMCLVMTQACIKENFPTSSNDVTEGEEVTLTMSVSVPEMQVATRAFGEYEDNYVKVDKHPSLWVVVFDQQGYLVEAAKAYDQGYTTIDSDHETTTQFSVDLHATPEPCIIHYLLNYDLPVDEKGNSTLTYGHESSVIGSLVVGPDKDVYWQRRVLSGGINNDSTYVSNNFTKIPLVRNFAKITVKVDDSVKNFKLGGFYVLNRPKTGTVAPYSNGSFVNYQPALATNQTLYDALTGAGYVGNEPDGLEFNNTAAPAEADFSMKATYLYENTVEDKKVTTILIKGCFGSDTQDTYYKADLVTNDLVTGLQTYAHILRNFHYELNITSVIASGKDISGAMSSVANNNLSGSIEIKDLTNVTNGTAGIYVSFTDTTLVSINPIELKYKFVPDITKPAEVSNERVTVVAPAGKVLASEAVKGSSNIASGSWKGWRTLTISPKELPTSTQEQTIVLYDQATQLRREVVIRLRKKLDMEVTCNPKVVDAAVGQSMTLNIKLDTTLNKALFPLDFTIESQTNESSSTLKQYISPASSEVISVQTGKSIVPGYSNSKSYQYIKTLSHDDYTVLKNTAKRNNVDYVILPVAFKTNIANNASTVYVRNQYFNDADDFFLNEASALIDGGFYGAGNEVQLVFVATTAGNYAISSKTLAATKAVNYTEALAKNQVYEKTLYTTDWASKVTVNVDGPVDYSLEGVTRNKLAMKVTSILVNGTEYTGYTTYGIYTSEASAKALTNSIGTAVSADLKNATGSLLVRDGLAENTTLWFAYEDKEYIYVASATAGALHAGAELYFVGSYKPLDMQVEFGTGADRYGENQAFTLTFTTNRTGKYVVTAVNFNGVTANGEFEATAGVPIIVPCSHSSWSTQASIKVQFSGDAAGGTNPETFTGPVRNKLYIKPSSVTATEGDYTTSNIKYSTSEMNSRYFDYYYDNLGSLAQLRDGISLTIDNLNSDDRYYFMYSYKDSWRGDTYYPSANMSAAELASGKSIVFKN